MILPLTLIAALAGVALAFVPAEFLREVPRQSAEIVCILPTEGSAD